MLRRLFRQRRRFAVFNLLLFAGLAGPVAQGRLGPEVDLPADSWITWVLLALATLIVSGGLIVVTTYLLPSLRHALEVFGIVALGLPALRTALEWFGLDVSETIWIWWIGAFFVTEQLLYGRYFDRFTLPLAPWSQSFHTKAKPAQVWAALAPLPENGRTHYYPGTSFELSGDGTIRATYPLKGGQTYQLEKISADTSEPPHRFHGRFAPAEASAGSGGLSGTLSIAIDALDDGGANVTIIEARDPAPLRRHLQFWLDDELGDRTDCMAARIDGRRDWSIFQNQFPAAAGPRMTSPA